MTIKVSDCIFCNISPDQYVTENDLAFAIRDGFPVTKGHTLIIPKRHLADYFDLTAEERIAIAALAHECRSDLMKSDSAIDGFNIGANAGASAGQTVFHVHVHLIPRRTGDTAEPRGGVRGVIPGKQNY